MTLKKGLRMTLAPEQVIPERELLPDLRLLVGWYPRLADCPERLSAELEADEQAVRACLEALVVDDEVLS